MERSGDKERGQAGQNQGPSLSEDPDGLSLFAALETLGFCLEARLLPSWQSVLTCVLDCRLS
jgi:hypothetical protein